MNIFRITIVSIPLLVLSNVAFADSEDKKKRGAADPQTPIEEPAAEVEAPVAPAPVAPAPVAPAPAVGTTQTTAAPFALAEQPTTTAKKDLQAPSNAFELGVGTAYTQGLGSLRSGVGMPQVAKEGIGFDLSAGYRINPYWSLSLDGQYYELNAERGTGARGFTTTVAGTYHFNPNRSIDPWIQLGVGYRGLWETAVGPNLYSSGLQAARLRVGLDFRDSPSFAIGPVIGADANVFLRQDGGPGGGQNISDTTLSSFIYAGIQGRFDTAGSKPSSAPAVAKR